MKKYIKHIILALIGIAIVTSAIMAIYGSSSIKIEIKSQKALVKNFPLYDEGLSDPEKNFEYLWKIIDINYGSFGPKRIDWNAIYNVYRPMVTKNTTDAELFNVMTSMLKCLNDNHVTLESFNSGILGELKMEDFSLDLIKYRYLNRNFESSVPNESGGNIFTYGWITDSIGYFHFSAFENYQESIAAIDKIIDKFKDAKAMIVDVRDNHGGDDLVGKAIADRFADKKRLYFTTRLRDGLNHDDFTPQRYWYVEPEGSKQFKKPVILLTNRFSASSADVFALAMKTLPNVTVVGDFTSGCFSDMYSSTLPNGWNYSVPYKLATDCNGFCWEGIGVPPDIRQINSKEDIEQSKDKVLELAISLINSGKLKVQTGSANNKNPIHESLASIMRKTIENKGIQQAVEEFNNLQSKHSEDYYFDPEEFMNLGDDLSAENKFEEAIKVFEIDIKEYPEFCILYDKLAEVLIKNGEIDKAREISKKLLDLDLLQRFPWDVDAYNKAKVRVYGEDIKN